MGARRARTSAAVLVAGGLLFGCSLADPQPPIASGSRAVAKGPASLPAAPAAPTTTPTAAATGAPPPGEEPPPTPLPPSYLPAGVHELALQVDGQTRRWTIVVPGGPDDGVPTALLVVLHGVGGRGVDMRSIGFEPLAAALRVVVAYPDGYGGAWNDGRPGLDPVTPGLVVDDIRFLSVLMDETAARTGTNPQRVAVVGFSNGAVMGGRVACDLADRVDVFALVGGAAGQGFEQSCRPARPVSMMLVAGSSDRTVPYAGGRVADWGTRRRGYVAPIDDVFAFWRGQAVCPSVQTLPGPVQISGARGADCRGDVGVVRYRVNGGGHEWFRPPTFDTTNLVWDFVARRIVAPAGAAKG